MKKLALAFTTAAVLAGVSAPAPASADPIDCAKGAVTAVKYVLQGTPQPQECDLN